MSTEFNDLANALSSGTFDGNDLQIEVQMSPGQRMIPVENCSMLGKRHYTELESPITATRAENCARSELDVRWKILPDRLEDQLRPMQTIGLLGSQVDTHAIARLLPQKPVLQFCKKLFATEHDNQGFGSAVDHVALRAKHTAIERYATAIFNSCVNPSAHGALSSVLVLPLRLADAVHSPPQDHSSRDQHKRKLFKRFLYGGSSGCRKDSRQMGCNHCPFA